jgi:hypothetical protein
MNYLLLFLLLAAPAATDIAQRLARWKPVEKAVNRVAGKYAVDFARMPAAIASLSKELLTIEATGDRQRGEAWFNRYDNMPDELAEAMKAAAKLPVDIWPTFSFQVLD